MTDDTADIDFFVLALYDKYAAIFYNLVYRLTGSLFTTEFLLLSTFVTAKKELMTSTFPITMELGWLLRILRTEVAQAGFDVSFLSTYGGLIELSTWKEHPLE